jgi:uncharacterized domain 1
MNDFAAIEAKARAGFAAQTMMQTLGAELIEAAPGRCVIRAPIAPHLKQQHGAAHAALAFAIGDTAAGFAALTTMDPETDVMTVEMKINLLSPAVGEALEAVGEVVRAGKRLTVVKAEVFALSPAGRKSVALLQGTMIPVPQR